MSSTRITYRQRPGATPAAELTALSANPQVVSDFAGRLLEETGRDQNPDPVLNELEHGRQRALQLVKSETK